MGHCGSVWESTWGGVAGVDCHGRAFDLAGSFGVQRERVSIFNEETPQLVTLSGVKVVGYVDSLDKWGD